MEASRLEAVYKQKLRKRQARRHSRDQQPPPGRLSFGQPPLPQQQAPIYATNPSLYTNSRVRCPAVLQVKGEGT